MEKLLLTLLMVISLSPIALSSDINMDFPDEVTINESFGVIIEIDSSDNFDVKLFIQCNEKISSKIENEGWKNPNYYIKNSYPEKREYLILPESFGNCQICLRLRESGKNTFTEKCEDILVLDKGKNSLIDEEIIVLNEENSKGETIFISKDQKIRIIMFLSFTIFSIIVLILMLLRKL